MAHFAQLDGDNTVLQVVVVHNNEAPDEATGAAFCRSLYGADTVWKQTSYNGTIRKNFAGVGYKFDSDRDAFIPPKPYASWVLNEDTCRWDAPVPMPDDGALYRWEEPMLAWVPIDAVYP